MARAGIFCGKRDIRIEDRPMPQVEEDDMLVKVAACAICGTDLRAYQTGGLYRTGVVMGHEFSGVVVETGENVQGISKGSRVCIKPMPYLIGLYVDGGFAEYALIKNAGVGENVFFLDDNISDEEGALVEPFAVGLHGVNRVRPNPDDCVAIFGAGPIGLSALVGMKVAGVNDIIVTDLSEKRLDIARTLGAKEVFNIRNGNIIDSLQGSGRSPNIVVDCAGVEKALNDAVEVIAPKGKILILSVYEDSFPVDLMTLQYKEVDLISSMAYEDEFSQAIDLISKGEVDISKLVTHRFSLDELSEAFEVQADAKEAIKVIVKP